MPTTSESSLTEDRTQEDSSELEVMRSAEAILTELFAHSGPCTPTHRPFETAIDGESERNVCSGWQRSAALFISPTRSSANSASLLPVCLSNVHRLQSMQDISLSDDDDCEAPACRERATILVNFANSCRVEARAPG